MPMHNTAMDTATEFGRMLGPLRRAVMRQVRNTEGLPDLPEAQVELLRALTEAGPTTPGELAVRLKIAPSTVSNLVRAMNTAGLLERVPSSTDLRTATLSTSAAARNLLERYDRTSAATLKKAMQQLDADQQLLLDRAIPALAALLVTLERKN